MEKRAPMDNGMSRRIVLSSGDGRDRPSNRDRSAKSYSHGDSRRDSRSSRSEFDYRSGFGSTTLPRWYHYGSAAIAITIITLAVLLILIGV